MRKTSLFVLPFIFMLCSCSEKKPAERMSDEQLRTFANELAHRFVIADGHVDLPYRLKENFFTGDKNVILSTKEGDFDYERAKKGGLSAPFMSIYIPSLYQKKPHSGKELADSLIDMVNSITQQLPDKFALAKTPAEVEKNFNAGKISLPMGMENGAPIGNDLSNVKYFYDRGIRYITLTHSKNNQICDSSGDTAKWNGLSPFGREVVKEMNRVGIMVDISHVDDSTFYQVIRLTKAPCIASHSSCRRFSPTTRRDMRDEMIRKMKENGGVIAVNFYNGFIDSTFAKYQSASKKAVEILLKEKKLKLGDTAALKAIAEYKKQNPAPEVDIERVADHIDHIVSLIGIEHVAFGSDFDGVDGLLPKGLEDVSRYPNLIYRLLKRGYTESDIEKICYKNIWRVWNKAEDVAKK
ncbi:MAG TPA: dipeptidase [Cyclobacteriaceae bacterium]|nr:dipeptidase [Cyclobacteriaceae bacterium]